MIDEKIAKTSIDTSGGSREWD